MMINNKTMPEQYREKAEALINKIGVLSDELYPYITELGDNIEIEANKCVVTIRKY